MTSIPAERVKALLSSLGVLDGFTIDQTLQSFPAPVVQANYPDDTANNVSPTDAIFAIHQIGSNDYTRYYQDVNIRLHLWTPTNGREVSPYYAARLEEISKIIKDQDQNNVYSMSGAFVEDGQMESGRISYHIDLRIVICDLN